jgi:hypothetical protein
MIISLFFYIFCFCLDLEIVILNYLILFVIEFNFSFIFFNSRVSKIFKVVFNQEKKKELNWVKFGAVEL